jgi:hypothetical protein
MEGHVRDGHPRRLVVEPLEERTLLSSAQLDLLPPPPLPAEHPRLTAEATGFLEAVAPELKSLPQAETDFIVDRAVEVVLAARGLDGDHSAAALEPGERDRAEFVRAAVLDLVAACATDARVVADAETASRAVVSPVPPHAPAFAGAGAAVAAGAAAPSQAVEARGEAAVLLRGDRGEMPPGEPTEASADPPAAAEVPRRIEPTGPAAVPPPGSTEAASVPARAAALLEVGLPLDLPALTQEVDAFFARLGALGEGGEGWHCGARLGPWLIVMTAAAFEAARRWNRRPSRRPAPADEVIVGPAAFLTEEDE